MMRRWQRHQTASAHMIAHRCGPPISRSRARPVARLRQSIVRIVSKTAYPPIGVLGRFHVPRLPPMTAKLGDMFITDLPWRQRLGRLSPLNCGLVRERGIDLTSTTKSTRNSRSRSTNSTIVLVEWPMVKKVFVLAPHEIVRVGSPRDNDAAA